jgi:hypothetical protein
MHLRPEYVCLSLTMWEFLIGMLLCCNSYARRDNCEKKNRIHFVKVRPSILFQQVSDMKNVVFWSVTPCSLIDDRIWFRENVSLKWAAGSTETSTHISIVFTVIMKFRNTHYDFLWVFWLLNNGFSTTKFRAPDGKENVRF